MAYTIHEDSIEDSPAYFLLKHSSARVLHRIIRTVKATNQLGLFDDSDPDPVYFSPGSLPFHLSRGTFYAALRELEDKGFIEVARTRGAASLLRWRSGWKEYRPSPEELESIETHEKGLRTAKEFEERRAIWKMRLDVRRDLFKNSTGDLFKNSTQAIQPLKTTTTTNEDIEMNQDEGGNEEAVRGGGGDLTSLSIKSVEVRVRSSESLEQGRDTPESEIMPSAASQEVIRRPEPTTKEGRFRREWFDIERSGISVEKMKERCASLVCRYLNQGGQRQTQRVRNVFEKAGGRATAKAVYLMLKPGGLRGVSDPFAVLGFRAKTEAA